MENSNTGAQTKNSNEIVFDSGRGRPKICIRLTRRNLPSTFCPMPKIKSAKKAMRQARSRTIRNKAQRSSLRTALKYVRAAATADAAAAAYALAARVLDRAARKGLIHKNNAARQKSRLAALVKRLKEKASA